MRIVDFVPNMFRSSWSAWIFPNLAVTFFKSYLFKGNLLISCMVSQWIIHDLSYLKLFLPAIVNLTSRSWYKNISDLYWLPTDWAIVRRTVAQLTFLDLFQLNMWNFPLHPKVELPTDHQNLSWDIYNKKIINLGDDNFSKIMCMKTRGITK